MADGTAQADGSGVIGPITDEDYSERCLDCQADLAPDFCILVQRAVNAGWTEDDVASALFELARAHIKVLMAERTRPAPRDQGHGWASAG
ncbi:hypothetical protein [Aureimonas glaciei]|uniref:Uncharacterized protein n=1 Tax=Aureimonas glaciei TaxID=1776957 RepID=A0A916Y9H9_9HYPH|nr:hypothetical protein [Aureimonas glaciei]GGD34676.1 hypothetical protein GCM10011335_42140 [Aureimonas glaciei]